MSTAKKTTACIFVVALNRALGFIERVNGNLRAHTKMKATIEHVEHLKSDEILAVNIVCDTINNPDKCRSMEDAERWCRLLNGWFVYRGGNHIAVHIKSGDPRRVILVA